MYTIAFSLRRKCLSARTRLDYLFDVFLWGGVSVRFSSVKKNLSAKMFFSLMRRCLFARQFQEKHSGRGVNVFDDRAQLMKSVCTRSQLNDDRFHIAWLTRKLEI